MKTIPISFTLFVLLFLMGWFLHFPFFEWSVTHLISSTNSTIFLLSQESLRGQFTLSTYFALSFAVLPLLYIVIRSRTNYHSFKSALFILGAMIGSGCFFLFARMQFIEWKVANIEVIPGVNWRFPVEKLQFERYLFIGVLVGAVISFVIFKWIRPKKVLNPTENFER